MNNAFCARARICSETERKRRGASSTPRQRFNSKPTPKLPPPYASGQPCRAATKKTASCRRHGRRRRSSYLIARRWRADRFWLPVGLQLQLQQQQQQRVWKDSSPQRPRATVVPSYRALLGAVATPPSKTSLTVPSLPSESIQQRRKQEWKPVACK